MFFRGYKLVTIIGFLLDEWYFFNSLKFLFLFRNLNFTMKKYYSIACVLLSVFSFAQQSISFEDNEGFLAANIHGQNNWISTPTGGNPAYVMNQVISQDYASNGNASLKIVKENTYGTQSEPIIGGFYNLPTPLLYTLFSVSFDINISQLDGSVFGFQGVDSIAEQLVVRLDFDKTGAIKVLDKVSGSLELVSTLETWSPNTWYRFKVIGTASDIRYYLNDTLIYTGLAVSSLNIDQLRFVHDNALGTAYIDQIKINSETILTVKDDKISYHTVSLYPNPTTDFIKINTLDVINKVEVYDGTGKKINIGLQNNTIDIKHLLPGLYFMSIQSGDRTFTEKFVKK